MLGALFWKLTFTDVTQAFVTGGRVLFDIVNLNLILSYMYY